MTDEQSETVGASQPDPNYVWPTVTLNYVWPTVTLSTFWLSEVAGLMIGAVEYLEALGRVAMYEHRPRPHQLGDLRLARETIIRWSRGWTGSSKDCNCQRPLGLTMQIGCPIHDPPLDSGGEVTDGK